MIISKIFLQPSNGLLTLKPQQMSNKLACKLVNYSPLDADLLVGLCAGSLRTRNCYRFNSPNYWVFSVGPSTEYKRGNSFPKRILGV